MKNLYTYLLILLPLLSFGQIQSHDLKYGNETAYDFVFRHRNNPDKVSEVKWNNYTIILAYYDFMSNVYDSENIPQQIAKIDISMYVQVSDFSYIEVTVPSLGAEGGKPEIVSVFQANADKDTEQELFILTKFNYINDETDRTMYYTLVFDDLPKDYRQLPEYLTSLEISTAFSGSDCKTKDKPASEAKFKTSAEIREELEKRGFKQ